MINTWEFARLIRSFLLFRHCSDHKKRFFMTWLSFIFRFSLFTSSYLLPISHPSLNSLQIQNNQCDKAITSCSIYILRNDFQFPKNIETITSNRKYVFPRAWPLYLHVFCRIAIGKRQFIVVIITFSFYTCTNLVFCIIFLKHTSLPNLLLENFKLRCVKTGNKNKTTSPFLLRYFTFNLSICRKNPMSTNFCFWFITLQISVDKLFLKILWLFWAPKNFLYVLFLLLFFIKIYNNK